jgi:hypothetical protein
MRAATILAWSCGSIALSAVPRGRAETSTNNVRLFAAPYDQQMLIVRFSRMTHIAPDGTKDSQAGDENIALKV